MSLFFGLDNLLICFVAKARDIINCCECGISRVIYSNRRLNMEEQQAVKRVKEELIYVCGSCLFPDGKHRDIIIVREGLNCSSPVETTYYSSTGICHLREIHV